MKAKENQELVSECMELKSKGIGAVAMAGKSIGAKVAFKFLDPILALAALVIAVIDLLGGTGAVGNDKADVGPQRTNFDFDHDSSSFVPASGSVAKAIEASDRSFAPGVFTLGLFDPALGSFLKDRVGRNADGIEDTERFRGPVDLRSGRASIGPIADLSFRKPPLKKGNQALQFCADSG